MIADRDLDALLDAWADEGPEVLPNRALESALSVVDTTPQRSRHYEMLLRYLPTIGTASRRSLGGAFAISAFAIVAVATTALIALQQPRLGGPADVVAPVELTLEDIQAVLLQPDEAPPGTQYSSEASGPVNLDLMIRGHGELLATWVELGLGDTWHSFFKGVSESWASAAMLWPDADGARQALAAHLDALPHQLVEPEPIPVDDLGEEGSCFSFASATAYPGAGALCVFRVANATFFVPANGSTVEPADVVEVSRLIASRASTTR